MKTLFLIVMTIAFTIGIVNAQENCLDAKNLKSLDLSWERALLNNNVDFFRSTLADDFIWVHNHASLTDSKESLLKRASNPNPGANGETRSRKSSDVNVVVEGSTAVITGFTVVDRGPTPTKYHFMRTYVMVDGQCLLLANHTMAIPVEGE